MLMALQYTVILAWFVASIVTGTVFVRMSCWIAMVLQTTIFTLSLRRLRSLIAKVNDSENDETNFTTNVPLLNYN